MAPKRRSRVRRPGTGRTARFSSKFTSLVEPTVIEALYRALQAGVSIDLVIRGICCLRPGLPGVSETIRVSSIVDKFLEHSRIFYFENGGNPDVFLASADWMPRNFLRRIETVFPIEGPALQARIVGDILPIVLGDTVKLRELQPDATYRRRRPLDGAAPLRSQVALQQLAREAARDSAELTPPFVPIVRRPRAASQVEPAGPGRTRQSA